VTLVRLQQKNAGFSIYSNFGAKIFCDVGPAAAKKARVFQLYSNFGAKIFCDVTLAGRCDLPNMAAVLLQGLTVGQPARVAFLSFQGSHPHL
jgi:hypothetical protein